MSERRYFCLHCEDVNQMTEDQARDHATIAHGFPYRAPSIQARHFPFLVTVAITLLTFAFTVGLGAALVVSVL